MPIQLPVINMVYLAKVTWNFKKNIIYLIYSNANTYVLEDESALFNEISSLRSNKHELYDIVSSIHSSKWSSLF